MYGLIMCVVAVSVCPRISVPGGDIPEPPQCDPLLDCSWSEQDGSARVASSPGVPVEPALEATEFNVRALESEGHKISVKRHASNQEGGVAIEMTTQPLLELAPMSGMVAVRVCRPLGIDVTGRHFVSVNNKDSEAYDSDRDEETEEEEPRTPPKRMAPAPDSMFIFKASNP